MYTPSFNCRFIVLREILFDEEKRYLYRGVARGGRGASSPPPPESKGWKKIFHPFSLKAHKKLSIDWRDDACQAPHDMVCPQAKNPSYAPVIYSE